MPFTAAAVELPGRGGTRADRLAAADEAVDRAVAAGAALVLLPEAYLPGYTHAAAAEGPAARGWLATTARRHGITLAMGYVDGDACLLGVTTPDGTHTTYTKRFLAPAEARVWRPGDRAVLVDTPVGRLGLAICADVLQLDTWAPFRGAVDAVLVAAAWPDYQGRLTTLPRAARPALRWLFATSNPYRDDLLARAARAVGAPVLFANATGPLAGAEAFSGGTCIYDADGQRIATGAVAVATIARGTPGAPLGHPVRWAAFTRVYRWSAGLRTATRATGTPSA
jgi:predicted amidohydrolase